MTTDYSDLKALIKDADILKLLEIETPFETLLDYYARDDFLSIDESLRIPFFAQTRDYLGAREKTEPGAVWIVKPAKEGSTIETGLAMICYFLDFFTRTVSAPAVITKIQDKLYRASKLIPKAEQLSGANYTDDQPLKEQLLLDLINRWIYCDEDRNPNNYMIKYNANNEPIIIAIDFTNVDLLYQGIKIEGTPDVFGWQRMEKTRYLTPLKSENFLIYDMSFFNQRFEGFRRLEKGMLEKSCRKILRHESDGDSMARRITQNLLERIGYLDRYFQTKFPLHSVDAQKDKYETMGKTFTALYDKFK